MKKNDRQLGMHQPISRRDLIHGAGLLALGLGTPAMSFAGAVDPATLGRYYPPTRTGLRGSHPGAFEAAHALAIEGKSVPEAVDTGEEYDLVVVGGGISGLAAAYYYQKQFGPDSRILILENHDDFGGHAKRNEFHQGGTMRLSIGGTHNLEYTSFSDTVIELMGELGVNIEDMKRRTGFQYGQSGFGSVGVYFDEETFGVDRLLTGLSLRSPDPDKAAEMASEFPLDEAARSRWKQFFERRATAFRGLDDAALQVELSNVSYEDFVIEHGGLNREDVKWLRNMTHGAQGFGLEGQSAREALSVGAPGEHLLTNWTPNANDGASNYAMVMFPDGNATIARLLVSRLIPAAAPGVTMDNVAVSDFHYEQLDGPQHPVRLRLNATALNVRNTNRGAAVSYVEEGEVKQVASKHCVLACYHSIIPHICPELPAEQKEAQRYQVKCPLLLTNVLLKDSKALRKADVSAVFCPGRLHAWAYVMQGNNSGGYRHDWKDADGPATLMFWGSVAAPEGLGSIKNQLGASRARMLGMSFEDYEREIRTVLDRMLGPAGFDVKNDLLAITVNRWPHGYAYWYTDLWDPEFAPGEYPHEIARQRAGNITIANADAAADAYTHAAIDQAFRAVTEFVA